MRQYMYTAPLGNNYMKMHGIVNSSGIVYPPHSGAHHCFPEEPKAQQQQKAATRRQTASNVCVCVCMCACVHVCAMCVHVLYACACVHVCAIVYVSKLQF